MKLKEYLAVIIVLCILSIEIKAQTASELYLSGLGAAAYPEEFDKAKTFAANDDTAQEIEIMKEYWRKKNYRERLRTVTLNNFFTLGAGLEYEMLYNAGYGPKVELRFGTNWQAVNICIGAKILTYNQLCKKLYGHHLVSYTSFPLFADARVNIYRSDPISIYTAAELAYVLVTGETYYDHIINHATDIELGQNHFASSLKAGIRHENIDFGVFVKYDMKPALNQKYIYEARTYDYFACGNSINERIRIGVSITFLMTL